MSRATGNYAFVTRQVRSRYKQRRISIATSIAIVGALFSLAGCETTITRPTSDSTPPEIYILKWEKNPVTGGTGGQTTINPGGKYTVSSDFLGTAKANNRISSHDPEGVLRLEATGNATGTCSTDIGPSGIFYTSSSVHTVTLKRSKDITPYVDKFVSIELDDLLIKPSCGVHKYQGMPTAQEFFLNFPVTWTINARAENCCGGVTTGTFTIDIQ